MVLRVEFFLSCSSSALPCNSPPPADEVAEDRAGDNFDVDRELLGKMALPEPNDFVAALAVDDLGLSLGEDFADERSVFDGCILVEDPCVLVGFFWDDLDAVLDVDIEELRGGFLVAEGDIFGEDPTEDDGEDLVEDLLDEDWALSDCLLDSSDDSANNAFAEYLEVVDEADEDLLTVPWLLVALLD